MHLKFVDLRRNCQMVFFVSHYFSLFMLFCNVRTRWWVHLLVFSITKKWTVSLYLILFMIFSNVAIRWQIHLLFFSIAKNAPSKHTSKYMTDIFQNKLLNFNLLIQLSFFIETSLVWCSIIPSNLLCFLSMSR